jgi:tetratricopeptide (TPR) repeat protein
MDAYDIPDELSMYQSQDMSKIGFIQDLIHGVRKVLDASRAISANSATVMPADNIIVPGVESLLERGQLFLEDSEWKQADEYFDRVLDIDPKHSHAYIGKLCAELNKNSEEQLASYDNALENMSNFQKALRFAIGDYHTKLESYGEATKIAMNARIEEERRTVEAHRRIVAQEEEFVRQGRCAHCGGKRNFFSGDCKSCGRGNIHRCNRCGGKFINSYSLDAMCKTCGIKKNVCSYCNGEIKIVNVEIGNFLGLFCTSCGRARA